MRNIRLIAIALMMSFVLTGCSVDQDTDVKQYLEEQDEIMDDMMEKMEIQKTGNSNLDFLYGMIPHHESAVAMSNSYLKFANDNNAFKQLAQSIIEEQNKEIKQMQDMIASLKENMPAEQGAVEDNYAEYRKEYEAMMRNHDDHEMKAADLDTVFAEGMIMHHQMAVEMANSIIKYSDNQDILDFAKNIVKVQEQEIGEMKAYLGEEGDHSKH